MPSKITKRGKTRWLACVKKNGQRVQKLFDTKTEALNWEAEARSLADENPDPIPSVSLGEWANRYLAYAKTKFSLKTFGEKRDAFKRFFAVVPPDIDVEKMAAKDALAYLQKQAEARSGHASNKDRKNLVAAWNWAIKFHDFPPNPFIKVERFAEERQPRYVPPEDDFWAVYEVAEGQDKVMLFTYLHLAARRSEVFRLTWADVDFPNGRVRLGTRKRRDGTLEFDWVPMTSELRETLIGWWEARPVKDTPHVFVCLDDTAFTREYYGKAFTSRQHLMERLCGRAGVKPFGFHAIRHLTASTLYHAGQPVAVIQAILRHKSPATTERYLRSLGLEHTREALESVLVQKGPARVIPFAKEKAPKAATSGA
jgi:integrase